MRISTMDSGAKFWPILAGSGGWYRLFSCFFEKVFSKKSKAPCRFLDRGLDEVVRTGIEPVFHP
jgi:hypothetical protein